MSRTATANVPTALDSGGSSERTSAGAFLINAGAGTLSLLDLWLTALFIQLLSLLVVDLLVASKRVILYTSTYSPMQMLAAPPPKRKTSAGAVFQSKGFIRRILPRLLQKKGVDAASYLKLPDRFPSPPSATIDGQLLMYLFSTNILC